MFIKQEIIGFLEAGLSFWKIPFEIGLHAKMSVFLIIFKGSGIGFILSQNFPFFNLN